MKNLNKDFNQKKDANLIWTEIQKEMKSKFGSEIYESWLKKIYFEEQHSNYLVVSVSTSVILFLEIPIKGKNDILLS